MHATFELAASTPLLLGSLIGFASHLLPRLRRIGLFSLAWFPVCNSSSIRLHLQSRQQRMEVWRMRIQQRACCGQVGDRLPYGLVKASIGKFQHGPQVFFGNLAREAEVARNMERIQPEGVFDASQSKVGNPTCLPGNVGQMFFDVPVLHIPVIENV